MTREGYKKDIENINIPFMVTMGNYITSLEQRIAEYEEFYIHRNEAQRIQDKNTGDILQYIKGLESPETCDG